MSSENRFLRPSDVASLRRNHRQLQAQKILLIACNIVLVAVVGVAVYWLYGMTRTDRRFAIRTVEAVGTRFTTAKDIQRVTNHYIGRNLFDLDIEEIRASVSGLPWVAGVAIEKELPDRLKLHVTERRPVAVAAMADGSRRYVDERGLAFAPVLPIWGGERGLPHIRNAAASELPRTVEFITTLRGQSPQLYSRLAAVSPVAPDSFEVQDRGLGAPVLVRGVDAVEKWSTLYHIARAENLGGGSIQYADLRFSDRIVIKPVTARAQVAD